MANLAIMDFNTFDIIITAIVILLGIKGLMHGFIKEMFGLVGLIGGVYFASRLSGTAAEFIEENFIQLENAALLKLIGFISILLIIWLGVSILGSIFSKLTVSSGLGPINRFLGFIIGGGKYFLIFALITTALSNVSLVKDNLEKHIEDSILYPYLKQAGSYLINLDPNTLGLESNSSTEVVKDIINLDDETQSAPSL
jgi:membrane protein required for colicin V production